MKKFLLFTILFVCSFCANSQITWDGGAATTSWNDAGNWVGDIVPTSTDMVLLDNSVVPGSYIVDLPSGAVSVSISSLTISPLGVNNITLNLPVLNTANPGFAVTGAGDALILNNGATLRNSSGALTGSGVSITNTFRINNGGHYIHNTSRANAAIVSQLSTAVGTELGIFEFDVTASSHTLSLSNRFYGTLILSAVGNGGSVSYIGTGASACTVRGNFIINTGVTFSISMSADFLVQQDFSQNSSSTFNIQSSVNNNFVRIAGDFGVGGTITESSTGLPSIEFNGTSNQSITVPGSITNSITFIMNNSAGVTLNSPVTLPYNLTLTAGRITTSAGNLLTMVDNATVSGSSTTSFVDGPMKKIGDDNFPFPIGKGSILAPLGISGGTGATTTDEFTAEYIRTNPQTLHGACPAVCAGTLDHISYVEYWTLTQSGSSTKLVSLAVHALSFSKVLANTYVSRWNGTNWTHEITITTLGPVPCGPGLECGIRTTLSPVSSFGEFTLSTDLPFITNPLPIKLVGFTVIRSGSNSALINWEIADPCSKDARFEILRSTDGRNFSTLREVQGNETTRNYYSFDTRLEKGITYYRLKMIDYDRSINYSKIVAVINDSKGLLITGILPNPVHNSAAITLSVAKPGLVNFEIYNISGQVVNRWTAMVAEGSNIITTNLSKIPAGAYHIIAQNADSRTVFRFVKQ